MKENGAKYLAGLIALPLLCLVVISVFSVSYLRDNKTIFSQAISNNLEREDADNWISALKNSDSKKALVYAEKLAGGCDIKAPPDSDYVRLAIELEISTVVFTGKFNEYDFRRWRDAFFVRSLVSERISSPEKNFEDVFRLVTENVKYRQADTESAQLLSIEEIWKRGYGNTHELTRLICQFALQAGYDSMTVSIFDENKKMIYLLCEIRGSSVNYVADAKFAKLWKGRTYQELSASDVQESWDENIKSSMKNYVYGYPAEFQDYKVFNQNLASALDNFKTAGTPVFGKDPRKGIVKYFNLGASENTTLNVTYWRYPFFVLILQKDFPEKWKVNMKDIYKNTN